jgi:pyruvate,water dikinase
VTGWRRPSADDDGADGTELFKARYHAFKLLLAANNSALETMAEMEHAALGGRVFGMSFVQSRCTAVGVSVLRMVQNLDTLAPERYSRLFDVLETIEDSIELVLAKYRPAEDIPLVIPLNRVDRQWDGIVGSKIANLGEVGNRLGLAVPPGFVISSRASTVLFDHNDLRPEIDRLVQTSEGDQTADLYALSSRLRQLVVNAEVPPELAQAVEDAYETLASSVGRRPALAVRSSAVGEDSATASFAGQYHTELNVQPESLLDAYRQVVASKYTPQAIQYRLERGLRDDQQSMCVGCITMVRARAGGVAYTGNPGDPDDHRIFINSTFGLPKTVVDGLFDSDEFVVDREGDQKVAERRIVSKDERLESDAVEGVSRVPVDDERRTDPSISDREARLVARIGLRLEEHFGLPQDVEWAIDPAGDVIVLQSRPFRPVSVVHRVAPPEGAPEPLLSGGTCVSPGAAAGPVFWVRRDGDALRFPDGSVLVLTHPLPRRAALMGRASAVLAEHGSTAGHLATVARELGLPGLFGISDLDSLEDGMTITVDATGRAVYPGTVDSLIDHQVERPKLMEGSPVHEALVRALEHITPLNLLDPDDVSFRPSQCRTLHDITRFCHEKSVQEMFDFGREHKFPKHESKQLHHNVPMQWWILNLDDGFGEEVTGKYVRLEQITSRPMLALWQGMVAVPWDGPPAMSGRGFASVLFEATANPALSTPFRKPYAQRNYFMISRNFMNLQSRFGFHFAAVEAVLSSRERENYLSFSFKGGAADRERRTARVRFITEILADKDFEVRINEDTASARVAALPEAEMTDRIEIIGYMLMHTRQLDMIMADPAAVGRYRRKMERDIAALMEDQTIPR